MAVSISEKYLAHIQRLVDSGRYPSADDVVARALALLEERDLADSDPAIAAELAEIRAKVKEGIEALERGDYKEYTNETLYQLFEDIKREGRQRAERRQSRATRNQPRPN